MIENRYTKDEQRIKEVIVILWKKKMFIFFFTLCIGLSSIVYLQMKPEVKSYKGTVVYEIGFIQTEAYKRIHTDTSRDLANYISQVLPVKATLPRKSHRMVEVTKISSRKKEIEELFTKVEAMVMQREEKFITFYKNKSTTFKNEKYKKMNQNIIKTIKVGENKIELITNKINPKLIVGTSTIIGFLLSILLVFFIRFIQSLNLKGES